MTKKPQPERWYQEIIKANTPPKQVFRNSWTAFFSGGLFCALAETARLLLIRLAGLPEQTAAAWVTVGAIALAALLTGCGVYDRAAQKLGAGLAVPISGFANSVAASMLEHKYEGMVLGSGCNSFKLAGAVVVFGCASAFAVTLLAMLLGLL